MYRNRSVVSVALIFSFYITLLWFTALSQLLCVGLREPADLAVQLSTQPSRLMLLYSYINRYIEIIISPLLSLGLDEPAHHAVQLPTQQPRPMFLYIYISALRRRTK